jgi:hypothetical protein
LVDEEGLAEIVLSVVEVMFQIITLVFQGIERIIFNLPTRSSASNKLVYIFLGNMNIGDPTVMIGSNSTMV